MNPVTVHAFPNPHGQDYVLVESSGALWIVASTTRASASERRRRRSSGGSNAQGIPVLQVISDHGGTDMWSDLVAAQEA